MDPTGINFEGYGPNVALDSSDALFVDAIHTDGVPVLSLGKKESLVIKKEPHVIHLLVYYELFKTLHPY